MNTPSGSDTIGTGRIQCEVLTTLPILSSLTLRLGMGLGPIFKHQGSVTMQVNGDGDDAANADAARCVHSFKPLNAN